MIKSLYPILLSITLSGCAVLRYQFEEAINKLPPNSKLIRVTNTYIVFLNNNIVYRAFYSCDGEVYKIIKE